MSVKEDAVTYSSDTVSMNGFVAYDESKQEKLPVVLIVHEWWGLNDYTKNRARQLAEMGYLAMAVDMYGNGKQEMTLKLQENLQHLFIKILQWQEPDLKQP